MNKTDIKQIILEEIETTLEDMRMSPEMMAADSRPEEDDMGMELPGMEEDLEEMARTSNVFKISQEADLKQVLQFMQRVNDVLKTYKSPGQKRPKKRFTQEEIKALATAMLKPEGFTSRDVIAATSYNSPAQANKFLKALEMKGLITLTSQLKKAMEPTRDPNAPETRGRKRRDAEFDMSDDPMADLDALGLGGSIDLSDPLAEDAAEGLEAKSAGKKLFAAFKKEGLRPVYITSDVIMRTKAMQPDASKHVYIQIMGNDLTISHPTENREGVDKVESIIKKNGFNIKRKANNVGDFKQTEFDISITTSENTNTMSELEKYIKKVIKEAKNPLAKKMKEIENQGRVAALETKLAAIAEMIEETEGRLTRIDEDNEFRDMMDKNAVKEVRKQLKELEKAKAKLEKERSKMEGKVEKKEVVDEDLPVAEDAVEEDAIDAAIDEVELEEDDMALNESTLRFQKLAGLITESDIQKKN